MSSRSSLTHEGISLSWSRTIISRLKSNGAYWIYDVPGGESRGGHAYRKTDEFIVAISGGFDVTVDDGKQKKTFTLNRSYYGLYIPKGFWRTMETSLPIRLLWSLQTLYIIALII